MHSAEQNIRTTHTCKAMEWYHTLRLARYAVLASGFPQAMTGAQCSGDDDVRPFDETYERRDSAGRLGTS